MDNPEEAKRMGENGRRAIKEEFNWAEEEKKLLALYEDILKNWEEEKLWTMLSSAEAVLQSIISRPH